MAVTSLWHIKGNLKDLIDYVENPDKTVPKGTEDFFNVFSYVQNPAKSPCALSAPASVYGHTGFTGTCAWVDPDNGLVYVFLSNRIYPDVWNSKLLKLDIRGRIQEAMYRAVLK